MSTNLQHDKSSECTISGVLLVFSFQCDVLLTWRNKIYLKIVYYIIVLQNMYSIFLTYCYFWFRYLNRFEQELNVIKSRHKDKNNRRFASREDVIRHTIEREREEYNTAGIGKVQHLFHEWDLYILLFWWENKKMLSF